MIRDTPVSAIMSRNVMTVGIDELFSHVEQKMRAHHIRHLPVLDAGGKVVGIISQRDFFKAYQPRKTLEDEYYDEREMNSYILRHFMTPHPATLEPEAPVAEAVKILVAHKYGCLPIVERSGKLVGIVTAVDILRFISEKML